MNLKTIGEGLFAIFYVLVIMFGMTIIIWTLTHGI